MCNSLRSPLGCCLLALAACAAGCGSADMPQPVSGTVKFSNGKFPKFDVASITFQPVEGDLTRGASGDIGPDGSYTLRTKELDGAYAGKYKVFVTIMTGYGTPQMRTLVARKYAAAETTPLEATVPVGGGVIDFTVDPAE